MSALIPVSSSAYLPGGRSRPNRAADLADAVAALVGVRAALGIAAAHLHADISVTWPAVAQAFESLLVCFHAFERRCAPCAAATAPDKKVNAAIRSLSTATEVGAGRIFKHEP